MGPIIGLTAYRSLYRRSTGRKSRLLNLTPVAVVFFFPGQLLYRHGRLNGAVCTVRQLDNAAADGGDGDDDDDDDDDDAT